MFSSSSCLFTPNRKSALARKGTYKDEKRAGWPANVRPVEDDAIRHIGIDPDTNEFYWAGERISTHKRLASFERGLAALALVIGALGSLAGIAVAVVEIGRTCCGWN